MLKKIVNVILILLLVGIFFLNKRLDDNESLISYKGIEYLRTKVVEAVGESLDHPDNPKLVGAQKIKAKILKTGKVVELDNEFVNTHSIKVQKGSNITLTQSQNSGSANDYYYSTCSYDRSIRVFVIIALFVIFLAVIVGIKGLKSAIALFVSIYIILFFDMALLMNGYNNILITTITIILYAVYSLVVLYGYSKMTSVDMISIRTSLLIAAIMVKIIGKVLYASGHNMENVETLILVGKTWGLRIENLLFSTVSIASLGALMDVSVSTSSSLKETKSLDTDLDSKKFFQSGMNIGKDITGTMVNMLVFAFIGASLVAITVLIPYGVSFNQLINSDLFSVEITKGLIGTVVAIMMVPVTSLFSSIIYNLKGEN